MGNTGGKKTVVLGASPNPARYSYLATKRLNQAGHEVIALGLRPGMIGETPITQGRPDIEGVDTVTLYINPSLQKDWYDYLINLHPKRILFNPGTENSELEQIAQSNNIETERACTLVLLGTDSY